MRNLLRGFNPTDLNQTITNAINRLRDDGSALGFTLSADNVRLAFLFGTLDNEPRPLSILLRNLLLLNSTGEFTTECHVSDGDILEGDMELLGALEELGPDAVRNLLTLGDKLRSVELGDNGFENFVTNGGEDTLVVVETEVLVPRLARCSRVVENKLELLAW